jgi:TRAP-type C4-dicarboxylate transport system permease small subunit
VQVFERFVNKLSVMTVRISEISLIFIMIVIVANVITRIRWKPVPGTVELVEMAGGIMLATAIAYTSYKKGHIMVSVLVEKFSVRVQGIVDSIISTLSLVFIILLTKEAYVFAGRMLSRSYVTGHLNIPLSPSIYLVGTGFLMVCLVIVLDILKAVIKAVKGKK